MRKVTLITTGGTIEKTYDEVSGELENRRTIVRRMLEELRLDDTEVAVIELMSKDSLDMVAEDRRRVVDAVHRAVDDAGCSGVVVLHGTDTLCLTGDRLAGEIPSPRVPVVLTGAWRPFEMKRSDALQNLTEAIFATGVMPPGVYAVAHGRALPFPGVRKDRERATFVATEGD
ncbi:MAG TPA: asparaginase domain-containing protein [Thermoanaerobaculia bacterium]|nr:asparaginase domain-containing protein [Thermoanaerobaculia bacterium]